MKKIYRRCTPETSANPKDPVKSFFEDRTPENALYTQIHEFENSFVIDYLKDQYGVTPEMLCNHNKIKEFIDNLAKEHNIKIQQCAIFYDQNEPLIIPDAVPYMHIDFLPEEHIQLSYEVENAALFAYWLPASFSTYYDYLGI